MPRKNKDSKPKKFRKVPSRFKPMRYGIKHRGDLRVYGLVKTITGKTKRISFQVKISSRLLRNGKDLGKFIRAVVNNIKYKKRIPVHRQGDVFSSFTELFDRTRWVKIRNLIDYKAGVHYER